MALWTPFAAGQRITAGKLNSLVGEWTDYTPVWTASTGTTTLGNGTLEGKYQRIGNTIEFRILFQWGSTTTQSSMTTSANWQFSVPFTPTAADGTVAWPVNGWVIHNSGSTYRYVASGYIDPPTSNVVAIVMNADNGFLDGASMPTGAASTSTSLTPVYQNATNGSRLNLWGSYEAAA